MMISVISVESIVPEVDICNILSLNNMFVYFTRTILIVKSESPSQFVLRTPSLRHGGGQHELLINTLDGSKRESKT